jgi:molybdopterin molybdotransferase
MPLLPYNDALQLLLTASALPRTEQVSILNAMGRVAAESIKAPRAQPPTALSAMDGYAVKFDDSCLADAELKIVGEIPAGGAYGATLKTGEAVRIFTGAPLPPGADSVLIQENAEREDARIAVTTPLGFEGANIRPKAIDFAKGDTLIHFGETLTPIKIALAAAANRDMISVQRKPRIRLISTGDELVEPGGTLGPDKIINSAAYGIGALITSWGGQPTLAKILPDQLDIALSEIKPHIPNSDVIVTIGGASVGDYDIVKPAFRALGAQMIFEKVAVKPGKPCWHAKIPDGPLILGLPGNPASASVCAHLFLRPLLSKLLGQTPERSQRVSAKLASDLDANGPRETYLRGCGKVEDGVLWVTPDARQDSSLLTPFAKANVLIRQAPNLARQNKGAEIEALIIGNLTA